MAPLGETLRGELRYRDGRRSTVEVPVDRTLPSIITGVRTLRERVAQLLTELTEQEKRPGDQEEQGDEDDDDDEDDDEDQVEKVSEPPAKKSKPVKK